MISHVLRASGTARVLVFLLFCPCLLPTLKSQDNPASGFKFTKIDNQLLDEVNELDQMYVKKGLVLQDPDLQEYLDSVGKRVMGTRPAPEQVEIRFRALRDPMVNAFASPNGTIYVTTGLLALLENEAQLAGVLGHELTHVYNRHTYLENRSERKKVLTINILQAAASLAPAGANLSQTAQIFGAAIRLGAAVSSEVLVASIYGYSREKEREADSNGLTSMVAANYDPHAMARSFELMDQDGKFEFEPIVGFYRDHPKLTDRRAAALEFASAHTPGEPRPSPENEYLAKVAPAICYNIEADIISRRARTAVARAMKLTTAMPDEPRYQVLLADAYRSLGAKMRAPSQEELSRHGQAEDRKEYANLTDQEEQKRLLQKPEGAAALHENLDQAEKLYSGVIQHNPSYADAYRGLGFLYEQEAKYTEAAGEYRHYLDLVAGTTIDHLRIERRLAAVEKLGGASPTQSQ
ncbi:MAG TPA: M48 family metalloprotease [Terracidiphilus sp.]|nr:M48 family metalloprotease [Terracidiphilus sp.]